ncbi:hypothetical protein [Rhizobium sp. P32RR-XVIII]|uniref:hypothetical protein n=1 Tax=Rhizobium sp. P32RR-XVIII TaxID=2726738 RepID=UPI00197DF259|nr:hypothetical protein [Rhizobium sp. P32RR-XVIII]
MRETSTQCDLTIRFAGHMTIRELILLTGRNEDELRAEIAALGMNKTARFGTETLTLNDARRLMGIGHTEKFAMQSSTLPGFSFPRLHRLMHRAIESTGLDLSGLTVLTEAASGAYAATAMIAALAGAKRVYAFVRPSKYGTVAEIQSSTLRLASFIGVDDRITVLEELRDDVIKDADIVTNSGHLRPISPDLVSKLADDAVIALMFEAWEFRPDDIDLDACVRRSIPIVGVNERHPSVDVFSFLGPLCVKHLHDCGLAVYRDRIALVCDNEFAGPMADGLSAAGAEVEVFKVVGDLVEGEWDAVVVALKPHREPRVSSAELNHIATCVPSGAVVVQFWGEVDREAAKRAGLSIWPVSPPRPGHMAILLSDIGPEPIIRLQAGGLRAAELVRRAGTRTRSDLVQLVSINDL